jgi:ATP-binding cassette, subfamily B (MDR/TAP), member 6
MPAVCAGRLSTIMDAHRIVVLREGEVAETGTHAELVARGGLYAEMWSRQQEATPLSRPASSVSLASAADGPHAAADRGSAAASELPPLAPQRGAGRRRAEPTDANGAYNGSELIGHAHD